MSAAAGLLQGMHAIIALRRNEPHWMLSEGDAKRYGQALSNALRHFPVHATQKALDFGVLAFCMFEMETPRVVRSIQIAKGQVPRHAPQGPAKIFTFNPPSASPFSGAPHGNGSASPQAPVAETQGSPPLADAQPPDAGSGGEGSNLQ